MSKYFSQTYWCPACEVRTEELIERARRDELGVCAKCGGPAGPCVASPMIMAASYPDGTNRGESYDKLKEISKLKVDAADLPHNKRGDIEREIKKLESTKEP